MFYYSGHQSKDVIVRPFKYPESISIIIGQNLTEVPKPAQRQLQCIPITGMVYGGNVRKYTGQSAVVGWNYLSLHKLKQCIRWAPFINMV